MMHNKTVARPDKSETLKRAHEAAAYQKWFRAQVQKSIDDPRPPVPHNEAVERMNKVLAERIGPRS